MAKLTLEKVLQLYWSSPASKQESALESFHAALTGIAAVDAEPLRSLKAIARLVGKHPATLWRLGVVEQCGERFAEGRKVYRLQEVLAYLRSSACAARRDLIRTERRIRDEKGAIR